MDFMTAAKTGFNKLSDFDGKAGRAEYWWYVLAAVLVMILVNIVLTAVLGLVGGFIGQLVGVGLMIAATVRRLNDVGRPAIFAYVYFGLAVLVGVMPLLGMAALMGIAGIALLVLLIVMIYFLVQPSKGASSGDAA